MDQEQLHDKSATEANLKLNEKMNADNNRISSISEDSTVTETNLKLDNAFYGENDNSNDVVPTYVTTETAAIKITGGEK